eukprot:PhM_4_TR9874/c0_g1_i1/m.25154
MQPTEFPGTWTPIAPSGLPHSLNGFLEIYENRNYHQDNTKESVVRLPDSLNPQQTPVMRCVAFFPHVTTTAVHLAMLDLKKRLEWDLNYKEFLLMESRTNEDHTLCHRISSGAFSRVGLHPRLFCYDRLSVGNAAEGFRVLFTNAPPKSSWGVQQPEDVVATIHFQEYVIANAERRGVRGVELTMTSCADIKRPHIFPHRLQTYISSSFSTKSYLWLYRALVGEPQ